MKNILAASAALLASILFMGYAAQGPQVPVAGITPSFSAPSSLAATTVIEESFSVEIGEAKLVIPPAKAIKVASKTTTPSKTSCYRYGMYAGNGNGTDTVIICE
jgi:hypothetical protein